MYKVHEYSEENSNIGGANDEEGADKNGLMEVSERFFVDIDGTRYVCL